LIALPMNIRSENTTSADFERDVRYKPRPRPVLYSSTDTDNCICVHLCVCALMCSFTGACDNVEVCVSVCLSVCVCVCGDYTNSSTVLYLLGFSHGLKSQ